jgi:small GTP-binding protein
MIDEQNALLDILDTAGQEEFSSMQDQWMREGKGFLLVYTITNRATFEELHNLHSKILRSKEGAKVPIVICGNKCDLESQRDVPKEKGEALAAQWGCPFFETSAKSKINHENCFFECVREIRRIEKGKSGKEVRKKKCVIL